MSTPANIAAIKQHIASQKGNGTNLKDLEVQRRPVQVPVPVPVSVPVSVPVQSTNTLEKREQPKIDPSHYIAPKQSTTGSVGLESKIKYSVPISTSTETTLGSEQEYRMRADYAFKFAAIKKYYPEVQIPDVLDKYTLPEIKEMYLQYIKKIHIEESVKSYEKYLVIIWMVIQLVGVKWGNLPMKGFLKHQLKSMSEYHTLLEELGEQNYGTGITSGWPVELRLVSSSIVSALLFVGIQWLAKFGFGDDKSVEQLKKLAYDFLTKDSTKEKLRKIDETNAQNPDLPTDFKSGAGSFADMATEFLNGDNPMASMLGSMLGSMGGGGDDDDEDEEDEPRPVKKPARRRKKPTSFASGLDDD